MKERTTDMKHDPKIENYLSTLERVLQPFPVSDRAEIVLELKSHILAALERDPQASVESVLASLGAPETVANRYLLERGLKPAKPPISPIFKWLAIGGVTTFAFMLLFFAGLTVWFTRHLNWNQLSERSFNFSMSSSLISGSKKFEVAKPKILLKFTNGKFDLTTSKEGLFKWDCKGVSSNGVSSTSNSSSNSFSNLTEQSGEWILDLSSSSGVKCDVAIPKGALFTLDGGNGKVAVDEPLFGVNIHLINGKVAMRPASGVLYRYSVSVQNGKLDSFESSTDPKAIPIEIKLMNGKISKDD